MTLETLHDIQWRRFHDDPMGPAAVPNAANVHCLDTVADVIGLLVGPVPGRRFKACGSHWALSGAAISSGAFIETNCPVSNGGLPRLSGPAIDLGEFASDALIDHLAANPPQVGGAITSDPCLSDRFGPFFVHVKAGTKVYEAYSLLDDPGGAVASGALASKLRQRLQGGPDAAAYVGPWAFGTLGGAGGQTVFGALTTGTHGGDYHQRPISDYVAAIHLVADGGQQYWIEPSGDRGPVPLVDEGRLQAVFPRLGGPDDIRYIRGSEVFDAVVVGATRFGVVTSIVLRVVPQYCLLEHRDLADWSAVKAMLLGPKMHNFYDVPWFEDPGETKADFEDRFSVTASSVQNRFLQIAINVCPHGHGEHRCGITQRWWVAPGSPEATDVSGAVPGRAERGTPATAGKSFPYDPPGPPGLLGAAKAGTGGTFLQRACASASFLAGLLRSISDEIEKIVTLGYVPPTSTSIPALAIGTGAAVAAFAAGLCPALIAAIAALRALAEAIEAFDDTTLASGAHTILEGILNNPLIPRPLDLMLVRWIMLQLFEMEQGYRDFVAVSYAVMDTHDYHDEGSCYGDAASLEVFFDAVRPDIYCAYLDQILAFEGVQQNDRNIVTIGYVSLRYVKGSHALIAPARYTDTVVMEIAEIRHDDGGAPFVDNAASVARHSMFAAPFHWGQINPLNRHEVNTIFNAAPKAGALDRWRGVLATILSPELVKDGFSSDFTRAKGLEP